MFRRTAAATPLPQVLTLRSRTQVYRRLETLWYEAFKLHEEEVPAFKKGVRGWQHFAGLYYSNQTSDLRKVRDHLRHASISSTENYMAAAQDTDEVKAWSIGLDDT